MSNKPLSERAKKLLMEATKDATGMITRIESEVGLRIRTNNKVFFKPPGDLPGKDIWRDALVELSVNHFIIEVGDASDLFCVTKSGYDLCYWPTGFGNDERPASSY